MFHKSVAAMAAVVITCSFAHAQTETVKLHSFEDGVVYTKPYTGLKGSWNEEFGFAAPLVTSGKWTLKYNLAYIQTWPLKTEVGPQWTAGATVVYQLMDTGIMPGLYTKAKNNLQGLWQQESGITAKWRMGKLGLVGNAGYIFDYPRNPSAAPKWQVGVSFCYFLK